MYHQLFSFLESDGVIDCTNELHMWALHYVYLPRLNPDLEVFREQLEQSWLAHCWSPHTKSDVCQRMSSEANIITLCNGRDFWAQPAQDGDDSCCGLAGSCHSSCKPIQSNQVQMQQLQNVGILAGAVGSPAINALQTVINILQQ